MAGELLGVGRLVCISESGFHTSVTIASITLGERMGEAMVTEESTDAEVFEAYTSSTSSKSRWTPSGRSASLVAARASARRSCTPTKATTSGVL